MSEPFSITFYRETDTEELEITVEGDYNPGTPAYTSGPWGECYPEDPPSIDIDSSYLPDGTEIELTEEEKERVYIEACGW